MDDPMEQSDNEALSEADPKESGSSNKSDIDSDSSKESCSLKDDSKRRKSESDHSNDESGNLKGESGNSKGESRNSKGESGNSKGESGKEANQTEANKDGMDNMFASVWVKVEMTEGEEEDDDVNDLNYEPRVERKTRQRKQKKEGNKEPKQRARPTKILNCKVCDYTTVYKTGLIMHMIGHTTEKKYCCSECNYKSKYRNALTRHVKIQHQKDEPPTEPAQIFNCDQCDYTTNFKWNLKAHKRKHNVVKQYKCDHCSFETAYRHNFLKHSRTHQSKDKPLTFYRCDKCPFVTKFEGHITRHLAKIHNEVTDTAYKCDMCDFSTRVRWRLNIHKSKSRQENVLACNYCEFQTYFMCESKKHRVLHYDVLYGQKGHRENESESHNSQIDATTGLFQSPTENNGSYNMHYTEDRSNTNRDYIVDPNCVDWKNIKVLESDDKERPFQCLMCTYMSRFKAAVKRHYQRHHTGTQNRPYECINCDFSTKTKDKIALHNKRSRSDVMLCCPICQFTTQFKCQYVMHQKQHYENKCSECDYSSKRKYELQKHFLTVHMGNGLKCQFCDYRAIGKESLLCHETIHTGAKPFKCNYCEYTGVRSSLLNKHMRRYHSEMLTNIVVVSESKIESLKHQTNMTHIGQSSDFASFPPLPSEGEFGSHSMNLPLP